jgi:Arc/MetJ-type ribon-helix-helix transcriptional regulator
MSKQIAVRLPDELVEFIDELVSSGRFESRAAVITRQVRRLQRQLRAERDAEVYRAEGDYPDLVGLAEYISAHPVAMED